MGRECMAVRSASKRSGGGRRNALQFLAGVVEEGVGWAKERVVGS